MPAYRIVHEALANVSKHAGASRVDVHVRLRDRVQAVIYACEVWLVTAPGSG